MTEAEVRAVEAQIREHLAAKDLAAAATTGLKAFGPRILGFVWTLVRDEEGAYEVYAQFSENLWRGIGQFRAEARFRTWAYQLAYHAAQRYLGDPYRRKARPLLPSVVASLAEEAREATREYRRTTARQGLARLRERLAPEEQALLSLRLDQKLSWREVALVLSASGPVPEEAALRKQYERLKQRLRKLAEEEGLLRPGRE